ncbi:nicotinate-nucleotide adenylyltransferase [Bacillus taeanensis]|uniref:Probable nicotinate-nucleotide adenylyltransferase n=1 Tax=Bacillus taeanensis TaxID=273032 RepID=A0A366XY36_9BACI|nr:nicotinate-nucleotide adenylyltransferase [Bacillus taeanensis]RBW70478.1 nicotinic acid mononucleotide adenylyltransferase [Bacillus taeanensis]
MRKVGIIGGTFDPPHNGHLMIAQEALTTCHLDEVWFMPSYMPPHKQDKHITASEERIEMVKLAIDNNPHFRLSLVEFERKGLSYTYKTLNYLTSVHENTSFYFIIGADMVNDLVNWYEIDKLLQVVTFIGVKRPGTVIKSPYAKKMISIEVPQFEMSSTFLRTRFVNGGNTRYFLPEKVREYIEENDLYGAK